MKFKVWKDEDLRSSAVEIEASCPQQAAEDFGRHKMVLVPDAGEQGLLVEGPEGIEKITVWAFETVVVESEPERTRFGELEVRIWAEDEDFSGSSCWNVLCCVAWRSSDPILARIPSALFMGRMRQSPMGRLNPGISRSKTRATSVPSRTMGGRTQIADREPGNLSCFPMMRHGHQRHLGQGHCLHHRRA